MTRDQLLQRHRRRAQAQGIGRGVPSAPRLRSRIQELPGDHGPQVGGQAAATLELTQDRVIAVHEPQVDVAREFLALVAREVISPPEIADHAADDRQRVEESLSRCVVPRRRGRCLQDHRGGTEGHVESPREMRRRAPPGARFPTGDLPADHRAIPIRGTSAPTGSSTLRCYLFVPLSSVSSPARVDPTCPP